MSNNNIQYLLETMAFQHGATASMLIATAKAEIDEILEALTQVLAAKEGAGAPKGEDLLTAVINFEW